jgi:hypothetical protein
MGKFLLDIGLVFSSQSSATIYLFLALAVTDLATISLISGA